MAQSMRSCTMVLLAGVLAAGCADPGTLTPDPRDTVDAQGKANELVLDMKDKDSGAAGTVELPASMLAPAISDLAERLQTSEQSIEVLRAIPVIWNNGAAGCPQPDTHYTQALVPGYWVVLGHGSERYSYHAARNGPLRLCEKARPDPKGLPPHGRYNSSV